MNKLEGDVLCTPFDKRYPVMDKLNSIKVLGFPEDFYRFWEETHYPYRFYFVRSDVLLSELVEALYK